jgi:hypothetical protein
VGNYFDSDNSYFDLNNGLETGIEDEFGWKKMSMSEGEYCHKCNADNPDSQRKPAKSGKQTPYHSQAY